MNIILDEILEKVKDDDLKHFKEKITKMEEAQEARVHAQGFQTVDDLVKEKYLKELKHINDMEATYVDATPIEEKKEELPPKEQNSDTLYQDFLKKLKG